MKTQGWKRITGIFASIAVATLISGCHTVQSGAPHPFTTMFRRSAEVNHYAAPAESVPATAESAVQNDVPGSS
ncbi:MAG: hypothetical protein GY903_15565 [Fuerstiella sp.]|nr:hypothetical protein [Fuerstiella sp.]MCP4784279.1 hypothetical protein [Fuerstiella sp.]MCP4855899.1 hypothetical protein [Fuerstiella sp.]